MADNVLTPDAFNERFTLYLNTEGKPVQRPLREMTAAEVMQCITWHGELSDRLEREAEPFADLANILEAGGDLPAGMGGDELPAVIATLRRAATAMDAAARLMALVHANMPQWRRHQGMALGEALRRFWPGGRAA